MAFYKVQINRHEPFQCSDENTVMRAMCEKNAGHIHNGCCGGGCGICKGTIVEGRYKVVSKMSREHVSQKEEQTGTVLLCCVVPRSDLIIKSYL